MGDNLRTRIISTCSKLTTKTLEQGVKYVIIYAMGVVLMSLLLTLNIFHTLFWSKIKTGKCQLGSLIKYYYIPISFDLSKRVSQLKTLALIEKSCWPVTTRERVSEVYVSEGGVTLYRQ